MTSKKAPEIITPATAAQWIKDGSTVVTTGFTLLGVAEEIYLALRESFDKTGHPRDLTLVHAAGQSKMGEGIDYLAATPLIKRIIGSHWGMCPGLYHLIQAELVEGICLPMGQIVNLYRAIAANRPGILSKIGIGTFIDPQQDGGALNEPAVNSQYKLISEMEIDGERHLFYKAFPIDIYIGRGTTADENGNITIEDEAARLSMLPAAMAAKKCGGKVIIQVKNLAKAGTLDPARVVLPGIFVDAVVVSQNKEKHHRVTHSAFESAVFSGRVKAPFNPLDNSETDHKDLALKYIGRRAVKEIKQGNVVNLGVGIPGNAIGPVIEKEGLADQIYLTIENGIIGGVTLGGWDFGVAKNPEAIIDKPSQFDYYNGWGVDATFMGVAEVDYNGNVNVSKFGSRSVGCGGFIDITQSAKKVVFCFTFMSGGLEIAFAGGKLAVKKEGKHRKFVDKVNQITFNGYNAAASGQTVLFITERAVFSLTKSGLTLTEVAPGVDVKNDILDKMDFMPIISEDLKVMSLEIFEN